MLTHSHCPCSSVCALQKALSTIGGKWKMPILCALQHNGPSRYNDLLRSVPGISHTMLSSSLRELEHNRLVERTEYMEVPIRVEYRLSERAQRLIPILEDIMRWDQETQPDSP